MRKELFAAIALMAAPAFGQTAPAAQSNILDKAVNQPGIGWSLYGPNQSAKQVKAEGIPGSAAVRVAVTRTGEHPWEVGATYPTVKPIAAGDTVLVAVYLRAPDLKPGETASIPLGATEADAPYTPIANETVQPGPEWKLYYASGVSPKAFAPGKARISVQLAGAKQVVELGPGFILDFGPGYDPAKLPKN